MPWLFFSMLISSGMAMLPVTGSALSGQDVLTMPNVVDLAWATRPHELVTEQSFTSFSHPAFEHKLRIKKHDEFCGGGFKTYTGYLDIGLRHYYFYFFESRNDPSVDPILMAISGGPGCAGGSSAFSVLGPCRIRDPAGGKNATDFNPFSWNAKANYLFIDSPISVGLSYSEDGSTVRNTHEASKDIVAFVHLFYEVFSDFKGRPFHMTGGSYAGRSVPVFASDILDYNPTAKSKGLTPIDLKAISIGNGMTDAVSMWPSWYEKQCTKNTVAPIASISECVAMKIAQERCVAWLHKECENHFNVLGCHAAMDFCTENLFSKDDFNPYDLTKNDDCSVDPISCYPTLYMVADWLSRNSTRAQLGVDDQTPPFALCSGQVVKDYYSRVDVFEPTKFYVSSLLERGVRALIFVGVNDLMCNDIGNEKWVNALEWSGQQSFGKQDLRDWFVNGSVAGKTRSFGGFSWATIYGAGHMSSYDRPLQTFVMMEKWLAEKPL